MLPTDILTVTLKRIINPVPMVVKHRVLAKFHRLGVPLGFDIEEGGWVEPDGRGQVADFWATGTSRYVERRDHGISVRIVFSNALDGVQESMAYSPYKGNGPATCALPPPVVAPANGYTNTLLLWQSWKPGSHISGHVKERQNHLFRVRTEVDAEGNITKANYAWTLGGLKIDINRQYGLYMIFNSYWNPDPTSRSIEPKEIADRQ